MCCQACRWLQAWPDEASLYLGVTQVKINDIGDTFSWTLPLSSVVQTGLTSFLDPQHH